MSTDAADAAYWARRACYCLAERNAEEALGNKDFAAIWENARKNAVQMKEHFEEKSCKTLLT